MIQFGRKTFRAVGDAFSHSLGHLFEHAAEDPHMERIKAVPVKDSPKASGEESGELLNFRLSASQRSDPKFQQSLSGQLHFSEQKQTVRRSDFQDSPEIQSVSHKKLGRVAPSPSQPYASQESVHPATELPPEVSEIPARLSSDPTDEMPDLLRAGPQTDSVAAFRNGSSGIGRIAAVSPLRGDHGSGIGPAGFDPLLLDSLQSQSDGFTTTQELLRDDGTDAMILADNGIAETFRQGSGNV